MNNLKNLFVGLIVILFANGCQSEEKKINSLQQISKDIACSDSVKIYYPDATDLVPTHNDFTKTHYQQRIEEFKINPLKCGEVVMLGDSLTEKFDWASALKSQVSVRNRGIAGDTSDGVLRRISEISLNKPRVVFLMIGTNDLWTSNTAEKTVSTIASIVEDIHLHSPTTKIFVQTLFPVATDIRLNSKVKKINELLLHQKFSPTVSILDSYSLLVDSQGSLNALFTVDGVHLNENGYSVWVALIQKNLL